MRPADARALVARLRRLQDPEERHRTGTFVAEGVGCLLAAVEARVPIAEIVHSPTLLGSNCHQMLVRRLRRSGVPYTKISPETFRRFSVTPRASGIALVLRQKWIPLERMPPGPTPVHIALRLVRHPGNLGTLLRTLEGVRGGGLIALGPDVDPFSPDVVRGSMGASLRRPVARAKPESLRAWADSRGIRVVGAAPRAGRPYDAGDLAGPIALLLGEERAGLAPEDQAICHAFVHLPILGRVDSLNLGVAGSLLLYEALRSASGQPAAQ